MLFKEFFLLRSDIFPCRCLRSGELFEDLTFTPSDESLYTENSKYQLEWKEKYDIKWTRASKMVEDPKFFLGGAARFDVNQGSYFNCFHFKFSKSVCSISVS